MDLALFGTIGLLWFRLATRLRMRPPMPAYNYLFVTASIMGMWLALKFKVLEYFNDTLNFLIIRNLGGGSLVQAFGYIADEAVIFGIGLAAILVAYWLGRRWVKRYAADYNPATEQTGWRFAWLGYLAFLVLTVVLVAWVNANPEYRYGLSKKTSYVLISDTLDALTDVDRDGFGLFRYPIDSNSFDANIYPGALDIPDNGIDEDGYGGDFHWNGLSEDPLAVLPPRSGRNILLIVLESARGDLVGKRWNGKLVAPNMMALAEEGTVVHDAYSHTGYTTSSLKAIFNRTLAPHSRGEDGIRLRLTDFLDSSGYDLSFISGQDESFGGVAEDTGMKGNGHYFFDALSALEDRVYASKNPGSLRLSEKRVVQQVKKRFDEVDWSKPNFFYVNLQAAHFPYSYPGMPMLLIDHPVARSDINPGNREALQGTYWNAIAVADDAIGRIVAALREKGVYEDTLILILGDHGESLFDDGFLGHGHALNETQTRIPFILNRKNLDIKEAVGQMDVAELLATLATDRYRAEQWQDAEKVQFQVIGSLNRPQLIGTIARGEVRTLLDLRTRQVYFTDLHRWAGFDEALRDESLSPRVKKLIDLWEGYRWQDHLASSGSGIPSGVTSENALAAGKSAR